MNFMIFDNAGNAVESFDSERAACKALVELAIAEPAAARHLALLVFDAEGEAVGEPLTVADLRPEAATEIVLAGEFLIRRNASLNVSPRRVLGVLGPPRVSGAV